MQILNVVDTDIRALVHSATGATLPDERSPAFLTFLDELELRHPALYAQVMAIFARPAAPGAAESGTAGPLGRPAASLWRRPVLAGAPVLDGRRIGAALLLCSLAGGLLFVLSQTGPAPAAASTPPITEGRRQQPGVPARPNPRPVRVKAPLPSLVVTSAVAGGAVRPPVLTRTLPIPPRPVLVEAVVTPSPAVVIQSPVPVRQAPLVKPRVAEVTSATPPTQPSPPLRSTRVAPAPTVLSPAAPKLPKPDPVPVVAAPVAAPRPVVVAPRPVVVDKVPNIAPVRRTPTQSTASRVVVTPRIAAPTPRRTKAPVPATIARARPPVSATASKAVPVGKAASPAGAVGGQGPIRLSPDAPSGDLSLPVNTTDSSSLQVASGGELNVVLDPPTPNTP